MGLALSCLRVLQLNLKRSRGVSNQNVGSLFNRIHELLDTLAGLKGEDIAYRFDNGARRSGGAASLAAAGSAVSQEAASALKVPVPTYMFSSLMSLQLTCLIVLSDGLWYILPYRCSAKQVVVGYFGRLQDRSSFDEDDHSYGSAVQGP